MNTASIIFLAAVLAALFCRVWLLARQRRSALAAREQVPADFTGAVPLDAHRKASDYTAANTRLAIAEAALDTTLLIILLWGGGIALIDDFWRGQGLTGLPLGLLVIVSVFLVTAIIGAPLGWYRTFGIETRFGFNRMTWRLYVIDALKGLAVGAALGLPLLAAVLWLMQASGPWWWLYAWLVWAVFSLVLSWAWPTFIAPIFNRFRPVEDAELKQRIEVLMQRCGFKANGLFVMDGSRRSAHGNAYFTGLGAQKRIVLFDTLLERLTPAEVEAVLAHELGHFRLKHVRQRLILSMALGLAGLFVLGWLAQQPGFYTSLGVPTPSEHAALLLFSLCLPVASFWFTPLASAWSRRHEFEADRFATEHSDARELASALVKLYKDNATTLAPDTLYSDFFDSHPPAPRRIARLRAAT